MNSNHYGRQGWKRSSMSHHSFKPSSMSRRRPASTGPLLLATSVRRVLTKEGKVTIATGQDSRRRPRCMALWEHASVACGWSRLCQNTFRPTRSSQRHNHQHGLQRSGEDCRPPDADAEAFADSSWHGASQTNEDRPQQRRQGRQSVPGADHPRGCGILNTICFVQL